MDILTSITQLLSQTRTFVYDFVSMYPRVVLVYGGFVVLVVVFHWWIKHSYTNTLKAFVYEVDRLRYQYARLIHKHRDQLYDIDKSLPVLYANKHDLLADSQKNYINQFSLIKKDMQFLESLVGETAFDEKRYEQTDKMHTLLKRAFAAHHSINTLLVVCTLGISLAFVSPHSFRV